MHSSPSYAQPDKRRRTLGCAHEGRHSVLLRPPVPVVLPDLPLGPPLGGARPGSSCDGGCSASSSTTSRAPRRLRPGSVQARPGPCAPRSQSRDRRRSTSVRKVLCRRSSRRYFFELEDLSEPAVISGRAGRRAPRPRGCSTRQSAILGPGSRSGPSTSGWWTTPGAFGVPTLRLDAGDGPSCSDR